ncbi:MAG: hypothetical protein V3U67_10575 [Gemmatimonadota bacterium]
MAGAVDRYECVVVAGSGTGSSHHLQRMFDTWAETLGIDLHPRTAYLCASEAIELPENHISLAEFEHLHPVDPRRRQPGYSPRLYEVLLDESVQAWVYRWSDDDPGLGFVGDLKTCKATNILEVIAAVSIRTTFGASQTLSLDFL